VAQQFDVVISGGRVMDPETGLDAVRNIGISDGAITAISDKPLSGRETIDASGHV
jgi:predicted amidohydrolase